MSSDPPGPVRRRGSPGRLAGSLAVLDEPLENATRPIPGNVTAERPPPIERPTQPNLLERSDVIAELGESLAEAAGEGQLVLLRGEAGVGKTAVVRRFTELQPPGARILWGACDDLFTPRALGPFVDLARSTRGELEEVVEQGTGRAHEVLSALSRECGRRSPTIVVLEDLHWADEATLDVLRLVGRRIAEVPALIVVTYRDDELDRDHPLRVLLGGLATSRGIKRLDLAPLSSGAVAELAQPYGVDAEELFRTTGGNPFFVDEALMAGTTEIPASVRDAVLARTARLSAGARGLLDALSVLAPRARTGLLEAVADSGVEHLGECLGSGIAVASDPGVAFRHELARLVIEESLTPDRRIGLHTRALNAMLNSQAAGSDPARLAHHAEAADDAGAVLRFAPAAAEQASAHGAHRESAAQYARALRFADALSPAERATLLERRAHECMLTDQVDQAEQALRSAASIRKRLGDAGAEGDDLRLLSEVLWCPGSVVEAESAAREAVALLEREAPGRELAMAYSRLAQMCANAEDLDGAVTWGQSALELARKLGEQEIEVHTLTNLGTAKYLAEVSGGREQLEQSRSLALEAGLDVAAGRAMVNLVWVASRLRSYPLAFTYLEPALRFASDRGLELWRYYLLAFRSQLELAVGRWEEAIDTAELVLRERRPSVNPRIIALAVVGRVRARRGDPDVWSPLDEALSLSERAGELQGVEPVAVARAEAAWLSGQRDLVAPCTDGALALAVRRNATWVVGELACWRWRAGIQDDALPSLPKPYDLEVSGQWSRAAKYWDSMGCPYDTALALASADDEDVLRGALADLQQLGAEATAAVVQRRLRQRGARRVPRGPRPATRANEAGLTRRELEVLALVSRGSRNSEIADQLVVSERTIDHHVSAILRKLGARTRGEASAEAIRRGLASAP